MQDVTITTDNFDFISKVDIYRLKNNFGYITKAKDRFDNDGILIFIPSKDIDKEISILKN